MANQRQPLNNPAAITVMIPRRHISSCPHLAAIRHLSLCSGVASVAKVKRRPCIESDEWAIGRVARENSPLGAIPRDLSAVFRPVG